MDVSHDLVRIEYKCGKLDFLKPYLCGSPTRCTTCGSGENERTKIEDREKYGEIKRKPCGGNNE